MIKQFMGSCWLNCTCLLIGIVYWDVTSHIFVLNAGYTYRCVSSVATAAFTTWGWMYVPVSPQNLQLLMAANFLFYWSLMMCVCLCSPSLHHCKQFLLVCVNVCTCVFVLIPVLAQWSHTLLHTHTAVCLPVGYSSSLGEFVSLPGWIQ